MNEKEISLKEALDWIIPILEETGTPYHITGGFAAYLYGAKRPVNDIDIDLPTKYLDIIAPKLSEFVEDRLQRYKDTTWDTYVMTLNYKGQVIDLGGQEDAFLYNKNTGEWEAIQIDFNKVVWINAFGHNLPVHNPHDLIDYKMKIKYEEKKHIEYVEAIKRYLMKIDSN